MDAFDLVAFGRVNRRRCESPEGFRHPLDAWSLSDWFTALFGELGEAANLAKKLNRVRDGLGGNTESPEVLRAKLRQELADGFIYLDLLAQAAGIDLPQAVVDTFNAKSRERGVKILFHGEVTECTDLDCPHNTGLPWMDGDWEFFHGR